MHLTDEQWQLIQPLIPPPSPALSRTLHPAKGRVRPPIDERQVLDGILWKLSTDSPWCELPNSYPSWQTCYRRYRLWQRTGLFSKILALLWDDLKERGGLDMSHAFDDYTFTFHRLGGRPVFSIDPRLKGTWQLSYDEYS